MPRQATDDHMIDESDDEHDDFETECGLGPDGQCGMAGSEHCDFCCPMRNSEYFAGSTAWNEKHKTKSTSRD